MAPRGGDREYRHRVAHALGRQRGAIDRVDGDIALCPGPGADPFAVVEHRGVVLLAFTDDDHAVHRDGHHHRPHRRHGGGVGTVFVSAPDPPARRHRGSLGDPKQIQCQVAVRFAPDGRGYLR
jgi:hypothetical protein